MSETDNLNGEYFIFDIFYSQPKTGESLMVYFVFSALFVGGILREISKKAKFPYPPMLLIVGTTIFYGLDSIGSAGDAIKLALKIEPSGILMIFIPILLFQSGFNADWYVFKKAIINIFILAVPGVLVNTVAIAGFLKLILGYGDDELDWYSAFALASIMSTTDPVVANQLKELGCSMRFNLLVEGEALLNNGFTVILFQIFFMMSVNGDNTSGEDLAIHLVRSMFGGPLFGIIVGLVAALWLKRITRDSILSISITFIACYLMFYFAETVLNVSGILALVTLSLFMSATGKTKIDHEAEHAMQSVWSFMQYACETIIFLLSGLLIGFHMLFSRDSTITTDDWIKLPLMYLGVLGARALMIGVFLSVIRNHGYGLSYREYIMLIWSGLRGSVAVALSLIIGFDDNLPGRMRDLFMFYTAGIAILTIVINGFLAPWLVRLLKMAAEPEIKKKLLRNLMTDIISKSNKKIEALKDVRFMNICDWNSVQNTLNFEDMVKKLCPPLEKSPNETEMTDLQQDYERRSIYSKFQEDDIFEETRYRLLRVMKGVFWEKYESSQLSGDAVKLLVEAVNQSLDVTSQAINIWPFIYCYFTSFKSIKIVFKIKDFFVIGSFAKRFIANHLAFIYGVVTAFVSVCDEIIDMESSIPLSRYHIRTVMDEFEKNKLEATNYIVQLEDTFPEIIRAIQVHRASNYLLEFQKNYIEDMLKAGKIESKEYAQIRREIDRRLRSLDNLAVEWSAPTFNNFMMEFPFFSQLNKDEISIITKSVQSKKFARGENLYEHGQPCSTLHILVKGMVREQYDSRRIITKGLGSMLNLGNVIIPGGIAPLTATCFSDVETCAIPHQAIQTIMGKNSEFEEKVYKQAFLTFLYLRAEMYEKFMKFDEGKLQEIARKAKLVKLKENLRFDLPHGAYIFTGNLIRIPFGQEKPTVFEANSMLFPSSFDYLTQKSCMILQFTEEIEDIVIEVEGEVRKVSRKVSRHTFYKDMSLRDRDKKFEEEFKKITMKKSCDDILH